MIAIGLAMTAVTNLGYRPAPDPREPTPATGICFEGTIEGINAVPPTIWVYAKLVQVPKTVKIEDGTGAITHFADLTPGLHVRVCGWLNPDKSIVASTIEILAAK